MLHYRNSALLMILFAVLMTVVPATGSAAQASFISGKLTIVDEPGGATNFKVSESDAWLWTEDSEKFLRVRIWGDGGASISMSPDSAPGCETFFDPRYGDPESVVQCAFGEVRMVSILAGDGNDNISIESNVGSAPRRLPSFSAELGAGDDVFIGKSYGKEPNESVTGGPGNDLLDGGAGNDRLIGGAGNDAINGDFGADFVSGGPGNDSVSGHSTACNKPCGDNKRDRVFGGPGNDTLWGGRGPDIIIAGPGNDFIGEENDGARDIINGGPGQDQIAGVDYNRRSYRFLESLMAVEKARDRLVAPGIEWKCAGRRCTMRRLNWDALRYIVIFL